MPCCYAFDTLIEVSATASYLTIFDAMLTPLMLRATLFLPLRVVNDAA